MVKFFFLLVENNLISNRLYVVVAAVGLGIVSAFTLVSLSMLLSVACYRRCRCVGSPVRDDVIIFTW